MHSDKQPMNESEHNDVLGVKQNNTMDSEGNCLSTDSCDVENAPFGINVRRYSSYSRLLRVTAWCIRFTEKMKGHIYESHSLSSEELREAELLWLYHIQRKHYKEVHQSIVDKKPNNLARQFDIFIDESGLLRCGGRLEHATFSEAARHPILLPRKEKLTHLLMDSVHRKLLHTGVSQTLSELRHIFWIPKGRATVSSVLKSCQICKRVDCRPYKLPPMASLPKSRVSESIPFSNVGLDYLGPLYVKEGNNSK
ncbi:uncharacterized protein LOC128551937 [Mercenaria mercenaria]|uniref:uncharacterized protein LOC128551937 n=1 Tax=Mercenaria mercenaria TaxID=6596 RepID=UPI00234F573F|nr:uncharacterized protein LOC128551937 [Mercenaria mercenaria]